MEVGMRGERERVHAWREDNRAKIGKAGRVQGEKVRLQWVKR